MNDWLDEIGEGGGFVKEEEDEEEEEEEILYVLGEIIDRLRKKIYEYFFTYVESVVVVFGSGL